MARTYLRLCMIAILAFAGTLCAASLGKGPFIWEADTTFGSSFVDKSKIQAYLDDLKEHGINCVWIQVELYTEGAVNYKKTTLSGLPTAEKYRTGQWSNDDFLAYVIKEAQARGMKVMIKFHGSNDKAWDANPDWRIKDAAGKDVLWNGRLKNFCVNSPYWDKIFFPMLKEIAANYDVDGFYLDTCQVAYPSADTCFCPYCKARFEKETGKKLTPKSVDKANWSDPNVMLYALKRVEWLNAFYDRYRRAIEEAKPGAAVLLNASGAYNSYKDGLCARELAQRVSHLTPEPVSTPRMYAVTRNQKRKKAGEKPLDELTLAKEDILPRINPYLYHQFVVKTMLADGEGKAVIPISRYWFIDESAGYTGPTALEIAQIESAIGAGAKGYCFFGYLGHAVETGKVTGTAWADPQFSRYLRNTVTGKRAEWITDMQPDARIGILYDRSADFWNADYWKNLARVAGAYSLLHLWKKNPVELVSVGAMPGSDRKIDLARIERYKVLIAPDLCYVSREDLETLQKYVENGHGLVLLGKIGAKDEFLGTTTSADAYKIFGIETPSDPEPSGFVTKLEMHPAFAAVVGTGPLGSFRLSPDKNDALSYKPNHDSTWSVIAKEVNDSGARSCVLTKRVGRGTIAYINSSDVGGWSGQMAQLFLNIAILSSGSGPVVLPVRFSETSSVNAFKSSDGMTRYLHIFTLDGESNVEVHVTSDPGCEPVSAEMIDMYGNPKDISMQVISGRKLAVLRIDKIEPFSAMIRILYKKQEPTGSQ